MKKMLFLLASLVLLSTTALAAPLNVDTITGTHSLRQNLMWLADPGNSLTIEDVSSGKMQAAFVSLRDGFPVQSHSPIWLHLVLTKGANNTAPLSPSTFKYRRYTKRCCCYLSPAHRFQYYK